MKEKALLFTILVFGIIVGVALSSWRAFPTEDMIARSSCAACHDVHGAIELEDVPFQSQVWVIGDVPKQTYFLVNDLFPYAKREQGTSISLLDLLARYGATDFERVALESLDGGIVIFERRYLSEHSLLVPYMEGIRFQDKNQHGSTWLKDIRWIIVIGKEKPLQIAGEATSIGRLLLSDRTTVITGGGDAIYKSPLDGKTYRGNYAHAYTGARLSTLLAEKSYSAVRITDTRGQTFELPRQEVANAILAPVRGHTTLVLPEKPWDEWISDVAKIEPVP